MMIDSATTPSAWTVEGGELVEVQSHTRADGNAAANLTLSEQRAAVVVSYLVDAGVAAPRLAAQGYGDTQPIDRAAPAKNERMSFLILKRSGE
jgi:outer membrane protein OmpA-like peptidoglycan-associated protein